MTQLGIEPRLHATKFHVFVKVFLDLQENKRLFSSWKYYVVPT